MNPNVYIVAGPNGAGKTTFAQEFLPLYAECRHFVNADFIARGVSPFAPESAAVRAGRLMLREIESLARRGEDFGFETTLSGRGYVKLMRRLRERAYQLHLFFISVSNVEVALQRIRGRVLEGGHDIPEAVVRRRFDRSFENFVMRYGPLVDSWTLFDNSGAKPGVIAFQRSGELRIMRSAEYEAILKRYRLS
jgi:predicted ABC-type ATPase